ncbi:MAG: hypothetical protein ACI4VJ_01780 [Methanosphaera sp.]
MKKNLKIAIIIIIAICIIIPVSVVAYNNYQYNKEQADFNNTMKKVSDMKIKQIMKPMNYLLIELSQ